MEKKIESALEKARMLEMARELTILDTLRLAAMKARKDGRAVESEDVVEKLLQDIIDIAEMADCKPYEIVAACALTILNQCEPSMPTPKGFYKI